MTTKLQEAIDKAQALPEEDQNRVAEYLLQFIDKPNGDGLQLVQSHMTASERAASFAKWFASATISVGLSLEDMNRDSIYN